MKHANTRYHKSIKAIKPLIEVLNFKILSIYQWNQANDGLLGNYHNYVIIQGMALAFCCGGLLYGAVRWVYQIDTFRYIKSNLNIGLSMTKWRPIEYTYPNSEEQWQKEFDHYKEFPEYQHKPHEVTLQRFKRIYTVEYLHRISGSALGAFYVVPLVGFSAMKWIKPKFTKRLSLIGALGLTQGLIGWWMVKSGLN